ncbi:MAG: DEAD/DEAH box helicase, partial [Bacteroidia bacterium]
GIGVVAVYGGANINEQAKKIKRGAHIVVATPGRLKDMIRRKLVHIQQINYCILDEADEMLNMGFKDDIETILQATPEERRTLMFSATMPRDVASIAKNYLYNPLEVTIGKKNESTANVEHHYYLTSSRNRYEAIRRIVDAHPDVYGMIFCRTRAETKDVAEKLANHGYNADALHGDLSQAQRDTVMDRFRRKTLQLLVATDVAARGIDVDNLTHVINYNLPDDTENYTHRSGRTGRAGNKGISIAIIHSREFGRLHEIERIIQKKFEKQQIPNGWDICQNQLHHYFDKISTLEVNEKTVGEFIPSAIEKLGHLDKEELIRKMVAYEFQHLLNDYRNAPDLNIEPPKKEQRADRNSRGGRNDKGRNRDRNRDRDRDRGGDRSSKGWEEMKIDRGSNHSVSPAQVIAIINKAMGTKKSPIGRIKIKKGESVFEVKLMDSIDLLQKGKVKFDGKDVKFFKE